MHRNLILYFVFSQFDSNGSGQIEFSEFCNMMSDKMLTVNDKDMIRMAFRALDKDGSGTIKCSTFKHLMTHIGDLLMIRFCVFKIHVYRGQTCRRRRG